MLTTDPHHDLANDIHLTPPRDCAACTAISHPRRACLTHTCPDCAAITYGLTNDAHELIHNCCSYCVNYAADRMAPRHFASDRCQSGRRPHCTCDTCY